MAVLVALGNGVVGSTYGSEVIGAGGLGDWVLAGMQPALITSSRLRISQSRLTLRCFICILALINFLLLKINKCRWLNQCITGSQILELGTI
jgi:hypothetical protein